MANLTRLEMDELRAALDVFDELAKREYKPYPDHDWTEASREFGRLCSPTRIRALLDMASRCYSTETLARYEALGQAYADEAAPSVIEQLNYEFNRSAFADVVKSEAEARAREGR